MSEPNKDGKQTGERDAKGRFSPGNKASPGRPLGRGVVAELREKLGQDLGKIIDKLREQALAGDAQAIKILLDRTLPALRPMELPAPFALPETNLAQQASAVVCAMGAGEIAPAEAAQIIGALGGVARIVEVTDLLERVEALEERQRVKRS
jgi:hypothetical protein